MVMTPRLYSAALPQSSRARRSATDGAVGPGARAVATKAWPTA